jgi:signal peptidase II
MILLISGLIILIDQVTKWLFIDVAIKNSGMAFGLMSRQSPFLSIMLGIGLTGSIYLFKTTKPDQVSRVLWGIIFGGILSNLVDRIRLGAVIDPFTIAQIQLSFNFADLAVTIGFTLLCIQLLVILRSKKP